jgi:hypothetical protein
LADAATKSQIRELRYIQFSLIPELKGGGEEKDESNKQVV